MKTHLWNQVAELSDAPDDAERERDLRVRVVCCPCRLDLGRFAVVYRMDAGKLRALLDAVRGIAQ